MTIEIDVAAAKLESVAKWVLAAIDAAGEDSSFGLLHGYKPSPDWPKWYFETTNGDEAVVFRVSDVVGDKIETYYSGPTNRTRAIGRPVFSRNFTIERAANAIVDAIGYGTVEELLDLGRSAERCRATAGSALE